MTCDPSLELCPDGQHLLAGRPTQVVALSPEEAQLVRSIRASGSTEVTTSNRQMVERLLDLDALQPLPVGDPGRTGAVTVVVPVRDQPQHVEALLRALGAGGGLGTVIVVDDGSADPTALRDVADRAPAMQVDVVRRDVSGGPADARNVGASRADTEFVVFLDADCRPEPGWLDPLLAHFDDHAVAMVAPRVRAALACDGDGAPAQGGLRRAVLVQLRAYELERGPLDLGDGPGTVGPGRPRSHVPSAALAVRRSAFDAVGGFDPSLRFGEDTDLVWRMAGRGWIVRYEPSSAVDHEIRTSLGSVVRQRFEYGTGAVDVAAREAGRFSLLSVEPANLAALGLAASGLSLPALGVVAASSALPALRWNDMGVPLERAARRRAGDQLGDAARLAWLLRQGAWPLALVLSLFSRRVRRLFLVAVLAPPLLDWARRRSGPSLAGWLTFSVIDALAAGAGVWAGCLRRRSVRALSPRWIRPSASRDGAPTAVVSPSSGR